MWALSHEGQKLLHMLAGARSGAGGGELLLLPVAAIRDAGGTCL